MKWVMFPDWRDTSPYQDCLAAELGEFATVQYAWPDDLFKQDSKFENIVFHLHWQSALYSRLTTNLQKEIYLKTLDADLKVFKEQGGRLVWTVHNLNPHEPSNQDIDQKTIELLCARADLIHTHSHSVKHDLLSYGAIRQSVVVYPHPHFGNFYPTGISQQVARDYFRIPNDLVLYAFFGMMRDYKGVDLFKRAFWRLRSDHPNVALLLAGDQGKPTRKRVVNDAKNEFCIPRFFEDTTMQFVLGAPDFFVFPFRKITTSGSLVLALGAGRPVVAPRLVQFEEMFEDNRQVLYFEPDNENSLLEALEKAYSLSLVRYREMCMSSKKSVEKFTFRELSRKLKEGLEGIHLR